MKLCILHHIQDETEETTEHCACETI